MTLIFVANDSISGLVILRPYPTGSKPALKIQRGGYGQLISDISKTIQPSPFVLKIAQSGKWIIPLLFLEK
jgi:hypothetical protein